MMITRANNEVLDVGLLKKIPILFDDLFVKK